MWEIILNIVSTTDEIIFNHIDMNLFFITSRKLSTLRCNKRLIGAYELQYQLTLHHGFPNLFKLFEYVYV